MHKILNELKMNKTKLQLLNRSMAPEVMRDVEQTFGNPLSCILQIVESYNYLVFTYGLTCLNTSSS